MTFSSIQNKAYLTGTEIPNYSKRSENCDDSTERCSVSGAPKIFPTEAASLS